jgi:hypothetical protein
MHSFCVIKEIHFISYLMTLFQAASISRLAVTAGEDSSRLGVLLGLPLVSFLVDLFHVTGGRFGS